MGDVFIERMVKKKFETKDILVVFGVVAAIFVLTFAGFFVGFLVLGLPMIAMLVVAGSVYGGY